jgi:cell division protein FtsI/penicillin-binding protein 2
MINTLGDLVAFVIIVFALGLAFTCLIHLADRIRQDFDERARQRINEDCRHASRAEELERQRNAIAANDQETRARAGERDRAAEDRRIAIMERDVAIRERLAEKELAPKPAAQAGPKPIPELPADLELRVMNWADAWARDHERRFILELYDDLGGNWDKVRQELAKKDAAGESNNLELVSG